MACPVKSLRSREKRNQPAWPRRRRRGRGPGTVTGAAAGNSFTLQVPDDEARLVGLARAWKSKATVPSAAPSDETATAVASVGAQLGATVLGVGADLQHDERVRGQVVGGAGASTHGLWRMAPIDGPSSTLVPLRIRRRLHDERDHREDSVCELVLRRGGGAVVERLRDRRAQRGLLRRSTERRMESVADGAACLANAPSQECAPGRPPRKLIAL